MTKKTNGRGGARPGAGRPKGEPTVNRTFRIPAAHAAQATHEIRQMLKAYRDRCKR